MAGVSNSKILLLSFFFLTACFAQTNPISPAPAAVPAVPSSPPAPLAAHSRANCTESIAKDSKFGLRAWPNTDFCLHSIPYEEIQGLLGKDRIMALEDPRFENIEESRIWLTDPEPVLVTELGGEARAYPIPILIWHEIVNDEIAGVPVVVTYCPLCNSALIFERRSGNRFLTFGTTGNLRNADLIMYDRQTESWWQQFVGEAIVGEMTGTRLKPIPSRLISFADFRRQFPDGQVLSIDTGFDRPYGENPYINYDSLTHARTRYFSGEKDSRLFPKQRVLAVQLGNSAVAYPYDRLAHQHAINDLRDGHLLVVFWKSGTLSPLYGQYIFESGKDIGSAAAFSRQLGERILTFEPDPEDSDLFRDLETRTRWNFFGTAVDGPLTGQQLEPIPANEFFWFAWAAFRPDTDLYEG